jgi:HlyD family secretion protein
MATSRIPAFGVKPLLSFALIACALASCTVEASGDGPSAANAVIEDPTAVNRREAPRVRTSEVIRTDMLRMLETTGAVESVSEIDVVADASGRVTHIFVEERDMVKKGDLLASLERVDQELALADTAVALTESKASLERSQLAEKEADARVRTAELQLEQAERDHARNLQLSDGKEISPLSAQALEAGRIARDSAQENLNQVELAGERGLIDTKTAASAVKRAELAQKRAERMLERCDVRSPIDGVIASRTAEIGANLNVGALAFHIIAPDRLRVIFHRPQRELDVFLATESISLEAHAEALPDFVFPGKILRTSPAIDRTSGAFRVTAKLAQDSNPNEAGATARLLPGMLLRLFIVTGRHPDVLVVPKRAVRREGSEVFVLAAAEGKVRRVLVEEGFSDELNVEVAPLQGALLAPGELVVTVGSRELQDGAEVSIDGEDGEVDVESEDEVPMEEAPADELTEGAEDPTE